MYRLAGRGLEVVGPDGRLFPLQLQARLRKSRTGSAGPMGLEQLDNKKMENGRAPIPNDMRDGFVPITGVFHVAGVDLGDHRSLARLSNGEFRAGQEYHYRVRCMEMRRRRVMRADMPVENADMVILQDDAMMRLAVDRQLRVGGEMGKDAE